MIRLGFDVGGTNIKAGLFDAEMNYLSKKISPFPKELGHHSIVGKMYEISRAMLGENGMTEKDVAAIGIASAGEIDPVDGVIVRAHNLDFYNVPMRTEMEKFYPGVLIKLINDAAAATLAEHGKGALLGCKNAILIALGTEIGGGMIIDGKLYRGGLSHGVELGHMTLSMEGPMCTCGNRGCIEAFCSATWLKNKGQPAGYTDAKAVIDAAKNNEPAAVKIFDEYVGNLSTAIASLANLLDPEIVALGGGVSLAGDFLFEPLREKVKIKSFFRYPYKIVPARLGNDAGTIGAAVNTV